MFESRYVVEGANSFERIMWICVILVSFAISSFMVMSNLRDVEENPIISSIDSIPVQVR